MDRNDIIEEVVLDNQPIEQVDKNIQFKPRITTSLDSERKKRTKGQDKPRNYRHLKNEKEDNKQTDVDKSKQLTPRIQDSLGYQRKTQTKPIEDRRIKASPSKSLNFLELNDDIM